jgi:putative ABC transport system permease protein
VIDQPVEQVSWYAIINDKDLQFQNAAQYLRGLVRMDAELTKRVDGIKNVSTPMEALVAYDKRAQTLTTMFYVVGSPMVVLALIFIGLTARISVQQYENETSILRARGTSRAEVMLLNLVESLVLFLIAIPLSLLLGWLAANLMNQTVSFLEFINRPIFAISFSGLNQTVLLGAVAVITLARFTPVIAGSRITIVQVKHEQSRGSRKPFWERFYLDFFLLIPGLYAFFVLRSWSQQGSVSIGLLNQSQLATVQQYRDPLLFVAPALFAIALSLVVVRLIPLIVRLLAAITSRLPGVWAYLSLQQIARRSQDHSSALLLIIIALGLSIFTVSTALTLDHWLYDSEYYKVGADLAVKEFIVTSSGGGGEGGPSPSELIESFLPVEDHLKVPGIVGATRVGKYNGEFSFGRGNISSTIMGIDRIDFPATAYYRNDFSSENLGTLMNDLGLNLDGVLVPTSLMTENGVALGDQLAVSITVGTVTYNRDFIVVGSYDYFPTVFPNDKPTLIANLDSIFNYPEDVEGYQMWLKLKPGADPQAVIDDIRDRIGTNVGQVTVEGNALEAVQADQDKPERMGLFGILNVGFLLTGLMPGIGFLIYSYAALRRRFIQLGILQAIGLSVKQLIASLVSEQVLLMGLAILCGAGIGLVTSLMFVPFLQTGVTPGAPVPPFLVLIGWSEAGWLSLAFGLILSLTMIGTIIYLVRLKVFQAVKLGETV